MWRSLLCIAFVVGAGCSGDPVQPPSGDPMGGDSTSTGDAINGDTPSGDPAMAGDSNGMSSGDTHGTGAGFSLRFGGTNRVEPTDERVKISLDDPTNNNPGPPADIGSTDFTIEFWMKVATLADNPNTISCGSNNNWVGSNIIIDRDRHNQPIHYGIGIANNQIVFSVSSASGGNRSVCRDDAVADVVAGVWQHVAVQRRASDGNLWILVDGTTVVNTFGPDGDISYPDDGIPSSSVCPFNGGDCVYSDPYLVFGAEKHGYENISYTGLMDEVRLSTNLRYGTLAVGASYLVPAGPFVADPDTAALYHFDEGSGTALVDALGTSPGDVNPDGVAGGPAWSADTPF